MAEIIIEKPDQKTPKTVQKSNKVIQQSELSPSNPKVKSRKKYFSDFLSSGWCYGANKLVGSRSIPIKFAWLISISICFASCVYFNYGHINDFLLYKVVTETKMIEQEFITIPKIVLCPFDGPNSTNIESGINIDGCSVGTNRKCYNDHIRVFSRNGEGMNCVRINGGFDTNGMPIGLSKQRGLSLLSGLKITGSASFFSKDGQAMFVYIYDSQFPIWDHANLVLKPSGTSFVFLEQMEEDALEEPYNDCIQNFKDTQVSDLVKKTIQLNGVYTRETCEYICLLDHISQFNNCSFNYGTGNISSDCTRTRTLEESKGDFKYSEKCSPYCPLECDRSYYQMTANTLESVREKSTDFVIWIGFRSLRKVKITQTPKTTLSTLISQIGGTLGLFIGFRFLSLIDISELFIKLACD